MKPELLMALFWGHWVWGLVAVIVVYTVLEYRSWITAAVTAWILTGATVVADWYFGELFFSLTLAEFKLAVVVVVIGALTGVTTALVLFRPGTEGRDEYSDGLSPLFDDPDSPDLGAGGMSPEEILQAADQWEDSRGGRGQEVASGQ